MGYDEELAELQEKYKKSIPEKLSAIQKLVEAVKKSPSKESVSALRFDVHKIAGNSALYGYPEVSSLCKKMDMELLERITQGNANGDWTFDEARLTDFYNGLVKAFSSV